MIALAVDPRSQAELVRLRERLPLYAALARKTLSEVTQKKGQDLGIRLFREFRDHRWRGSRHGPAGVAFREARARARRGEGTQVRPGLSAAALAGAPVSYRYRIPGTGRIATRRTSLWQRRWFAELRLRQAGIGVLAASFLWFRQRSSQARGRYLVRNKSGRPLGEVQAGEDFVRILGYKSGLGTVAARYGLVARALAAVNADMEVYLVRKLAEAGRSFSLTK